MLVTCKRESFITAVLEVIKLYKYRRKPNDIIFVEMRKKTLLLGAEFKVWAAQCEIPVIKSKNYKRIKVSFEVNQLIHFLKEQKTELMRLCVRKSGLFVSCEKRKIKLSFRKEKFPEKYFLKEQFLARIDGSEFYRGLRDMLYYFDQKTDFWKDIDFYVEMKDKSLRIIGVAERDEETLQIKVPVIKGEIDFVESLCRRTFSFLKDFVCGGKIDLIKDRGKRLRFRMGNGVCFIVAGAFKNEQKVCEFEEKQKKKPFVKGGEISCDNILKSIKDFEKISRLQRRSDWYVFSVSKHNQVVSFYDGFCFSLRKASGNEEGTILVKRKLFKILLGKKDVGFIFELQKGPRSEGYSRIRLVTKDNSLICSAYCRGFYEGCL